MQCFSSLHCCWKLVLYKESYLIIRKLYNIAYHFSLVPSSEPTLVAVQSESTNATLSWSKPSDVGHPGVTAYQITADDGINTPITYTSADNNTAQTITGLLPGREYRFTVRALVGSGDAVAISNASLPVYANTTFTGEWRMCLFLFQLVRVG